MVRNLGCGKKKLVMWCCDKKASFSMSGMDRDQNGSFGMAGMYRR
jgi:hypothetical protein